MDGWRRSRDAYIVYLWRSQKERRWIKKVASWREMAWKGGGRRGFWILAFLLLGSKLGQGRARGRRDDGGLTFPLVSTRACRKPVAKRDEIVLACWGHRTGGERKQIKKMMCINKSIIYWYIAVMNTFVIYICSIIYISLQSLSLVIYQYVCQLSL